MACVQVEWKIKDGELPSKSIVKQEASWLLDKTFHLPSGRLISVQAGTRDSVLDHNKPGINGNGSIASDYTLRRKYRFDLFNKFNK